MTSLSSAAHPRLFISTFFMYCPRRSDPRLSSSSLFSFRLPDSSFVSSARLPRRLLFGIVIGGGAIARQSCSGVHRICKNVAQSGENVAQRRVSGWPSLRESESSQAHRLDRPWPRSASCSAAGVSVTKRPLLKNWCACRLQRTDWRSSIDHHGYINDRPSIDHYGYIDDHQRQRMFRTKTALQHMQTMTNLTSLPQAQKNSREQATAGEMVEPVLVLSNSVADCEVEGGMNVKVKRRRGRPSMKSQRERGEAENREGKGGLDAEQEGARLSTDLNMETEMAMAIVPPAGPWEIDVPSSSSSSYHKDTVERTASAVDWQNVKLWVVFSDLHLSRKTSSTCLTVLKRVHKEALARYAGIIFLGDFWHARGALPVLLLNMVMEELKTWTQPMLMIPGNHDQVTIGGHIHALMPIAASNEKILVFDEPTEFLNALWIPYRRDEQDMKRVVEENRTVKAIFAHADVVGAFMNEAFQAKHGIDPRLFPEQIPVYTGHYHKPHIVENTMIEYVGSPYQVSRGESGQMKRLLVLDNYWKKVEEIPLDIGSRHFVISTDDVTNPTASLPDLHSGDTVRWLLPANADQEAVKMEMEKLLSAGIQVEPVYPGVTTKPRIQSAEDLDSFGLLEAYAKIVGMSEGALLMGLSLLRNVDVPSKLLQRPHARVVFEEVRLQGYGPFLEPVCYDLANRGFRVVSGRNEDSVGSDSNGAGKTTLVMAPLWALTGCTDPRPDSPRGLTSSDVINPMANSACVRLDGKLNGKPFVIERIAGRRSALRFEMDGEDLTCQEMRLTQEAINDHLDTWVLQRTVFHGQHAIGSLLDAGDRDFKEELGRLVGLELWVAAREKCKEALREARMEIERESGALLELGRHLEEVSQQIADCKEQEQAWEQERSRRKQLCQERLQRISEDLRKSVELCHESFELLQAQVAMAENGTVREGAEQPGLECDEEKNNVTALSETANRLEMEAQELQKKLAVIAYKMESAERDARASQSKVEKFSANAVRAQVCETCLQPVDISHAKHCLADLEENHKNVLQGVIRIEKDRDEVRVSLAEVNRESQQTSALRDSLLEQKAKRVVMVREAEKKLYAEFAVAKALLNKASQVLTMPAISLSRIGNNEGSGDQTLTFSESSPSSSSPLSLCSKGDDSETVGNDPPRSIQAMCGGGGVIGVVAFPGDWRERWVETSRVEIRSLHERIEQVENLTQAMRNEELEVERVEREGNMYVGRREAMESICVRRKEEEEKRRKSVQDAEQHAAWLRELDTACGITGIQSYILEEALAQLQAKVTGYLEALSGGSLGLTLSATRHAKTSKNSIERIEKIAYVRQSDGTVLVRSLGQLSGGERRRQVLAMALAYADFASERTGTHCDLIVLDEVLQHLDTEGRDRVISLLRGMDKGTVLVVSQAFSDLAESFDKIDWVVKSRDMATISSSEDGGM